MTLALLNHPATSFSVPYSRFDFLVRMPKLARQLLSPRYVSADWLSIDNWECVTRIQIFHFGTVFHLTRHARA